MPYIPKDEREGLRYEGQPKTTGQLNYAITRVVGAYLGANPNYSRFNDAMGALESAKLELYRRLVAGYEDTKLKQNGDVYR